jgi:hypothetical protein
MKLSHLVAVSPSLVGALACSGEIGGPRGSGFGDPNDPNAVFAEATAQPPGVAPSTGAPDAADATGAPGSTPSGTASSVPGSATPGTDDADSTPSTSVAIAIANAEWLPLLLHGEPLYARVVRLTHDQWENSTRYILQLDETGHRQNLAEDASAVYDFSTHEELLFLNANLYRDYQMAAEELAAAIGADERAISAVTPGQDAAAFIEEVGRRAYRRPLTPEEAERLQAEYDEGAALSENGSTPHARGVALVLQTLLQSPYFLYRTEFTPSGMRLSDYEIAAKLSLLLRAVTPDDALLEAAGQGQLASDQGVRSMAEQMLDEPAAADVMRQFHGELFSFHNILNITKDPEEVPEYSSELNDELYDSAARFFDRIYTRSLGFSDILTSTIGYVGPAMASLYGLQAPAFGMQEMELGPDRPGFFTQLPFLIVNSQNLLPDPIHRGVTLNLDVLCAEIPLPGMVDTTLPAFEAGQSNRQRITAGTGPGTCGAGCHAPYINPLGFAFENFDGLGRLRDTDNGNPIDAQAQYPFKEGTKEFTGAPELMQIMADSEQSHACYSKHLAGFALQRELTNEDQALVDALMTESRAGASVKELLLALVSNPAFTTRAVGGVQ